MSSTEMLGVNCNLQYIIRNIIMNLLSLISTYLSISALYYILKISKKSQVSFHPILFCSYIIFYTCSIFNSSFAIASDMSFCFASRTNTNILNEYIFYGLEVFFYASSWLMFNIILFIRLYFTFRHTVYGISNKCLIISTLLLLFILLLFVLRFLSIFCKILILLFLSLHLVWHMF